MPFGSQQPGGIAQLPFLASEPLPTGFEDPEQFNLENDFTGGQGGNLLDNLETLQTVPEEEAVPFDLPPYIPPKTKWNIGEGLMSDDEFNALLRQKLTASQGPLSAFNPTDPVVMDLKRRGYTDEQIARTLPKPKPSSGNKTADDNLDLVERSQADLREWNKENPGKEWGRYFADRSIPGFSTGKQLGAVWHAYDAAEKIDTNPLSEDEALLLARWLNDNEDAQKRKGLAYAGDLIAEQPAFWGEMLATGGAGTVARKGLQKLAVKMIGRKMAARVAAKGIGLAAHSVVQSNLMPQRIAKTAIERQIRLPGDKTPRESWTSSFANAQFQNFVEILTEKVGGKVIKRYVVRPLGRIATELSKKTGLYDGLRMKLAAEWLKKHTHATVQDFYNRTAKAAGWDGILAEFGEERVNEIILGTAGVLGATGQEYDFGVIGDTATGVTGLPGIFDSSEEVRRIRKKDFDSGNLTPEEKAILENANQLSGFGKAYDRIWPELLAFSGPGATAKTVSVAWKAWKNLSNAQREKIDDYLDNPRNKERYTEAVDSGMPPIPEGEPTNQDGRTKHAEVMRSAFSESETKDVLADEYGKKVADQYRQQMKLKSSVELLMQHREAGTERLQAFVDEEVERRGGVDAVREAMRVETEKNREFLDEYWKGVIPSEKQDMSQVREKEVPVRKGVLSEEDDLANMLETVTDDADAAEGANAPTDSAAVSPPTASDQSDQDQAAPDWLKQNIAQIVAPFEANGVADQVEALARQRLTKKQIAKQLGIDADEVNAIRASRGIPSMDLKDEFEEWINKKPPSVAQPASASLPPQVTEAAPAAVSVSAPASETPVNRASQWAGQKPVKDLGNGVVITTQKAADGSIVPVTVVHSSREVIHITKDGKGVWFYRSFAGTGKKQQGHWYPVGGFVKDKQGGSWIIKGDPTGDKAFGRAGLAELEDYINQVMPSDDAGVDAFFKELGVQSLGVTGPEKGADYEVDDVGSNAGKEAILNHWKNDRLNPIWGKRAAKQAAPASETPKTPQERVADIAKQAMSENWSDRLIADRAKSAGVSPQAVKFAITKAQRKAEAKPAAVVEKQPWEMTRDEYAKEYGDADNWSSIVRRNIESGKDVPSHVVADLEAYDAKRAAKMAPPKQEAEKAKLGDTIIRYTHRDGTGLLNNSGLDRSKLTDKEEDELVHLMDLGLQQPPSGVSGTFYFTKQGEKKHSRMLKLLAKASKSGIVRTESTLGSTPTWESGDGQLAVEPQPAPAVAKQPWEMTRVEDMHRRGADAPLENESFVDAHLSVVADGKPGLSVEGDKIIVRDGDGKPVGVTTLRTTGGEKVVDDTAVRADSRRKGIATQLYAKAKELGYEAGYVENVASAGAKHKLAVVQAIAAGKPVPAAVLAEYPELQKAATANKQPADSEHKPYSIAALKDAFNLTDEQAIAVDLFIQSLGLDTSKIWIVKGGQPGKGALLQIEDFISGKRKLPRKDRDTKVHMGWLKKFIDTKLKRLKTPIMGNLADFLWMQDKNGKRIVNEKGRKRLIKKIYNDSKAEHEAWLKINAAYQGFYDDMIATANGHLQDLAFKRYGVHLTPNEIKFFHLASTFGSPSASPAVDSEAGMIILDKFMQHRKIKDINALGNKLKTVWVSDANGARIDTGVIYKDKDGNTKISKIGRAYADDSLASFVHVANKLGSVDAAIDWLSTKHTSADMTEMMLDEVRYKKDGTLAAPYKIGTSNARRPVHEYLHLTDGGYGIFAIAGPKLGSYFLNRTGIYDTITKDLWYARTMARMLGQELYPLVKKPKADAEVEAEDGAEDGVAVNSDPTRELLKKPWSASTENGRLLRQIADDAWFKLSKELGIEPAILQQRMWDLEKRFYESLGQPAGVSTVDQGIANSLDKLPLALRREGSTRPDSEIAKDVHDASVAAAEESLDSINDLYVPAAGQLTLFQGEKGATEFLENGASLIRGMSNPNLDTALEEILHVARRQILNRDIPAEQRAGITDADIDVIEKACGVKDGVWTVAAEERFPKLVRGHLLSGRTMISGKLRDALQKVAEWIAKIYENVKRGHILKVSPEVAIALDKFLDRMRIVRELQKAAATLNTTASAKTVPSPPLSAAAVSSPPAVAAPAVEAKTNVKDDTSKLELPFIEERLEPDQYGPDRRIARYGTKDREVVVHYTIRDGVATGLNIASSDLGKRGTVGVRVLNQIKDDITKRTGVTAFEGQRVSGAKPDGRTVKTRVSKAVKAAESYGGWMSNWKPKPTADEFIAARNKSVRSGYLSPLKPADLTGSKVYLSADGTVGAILSVDGDVQNVFNNGGPKGAGTEAVLAAITAGGYTLDCFDAYLPKFYRQFGFIETGRMKFNREYAPDGWNYDELGEPDVVFMALAEKDSEDVIRTRATGPKTEWTPNDRSSRYYTDFDQAKSDSRRARSAGHGGSERRSGLRGQERGTDSGSSPIDRESVAKGLSTDAAGVQSDAPADERRSSAKEPSHAAELSAETIEAEPNAAAHPEGSEPSSEVVKAADRAAESKGRDESPADARQGRVDALPDDTRQGGQQLLDAIQERQTSLAGRTDAADIKDIKRDLVKLNKVLDKYLAAAESLEPPKEKPVRVRPSVAKSAVVTDEHHAAVAFFQKQFSDEAVVDAIKAGLIADKYGTPSAKVSNLAAVVLDVKRLAKRPSSMYDPNHAETVDAEGNARQAIPGFDAATSKFIRWATYQANTISQPSGAERKAAAKQQALDDWSDVGKHMRDIGKGGTPSVFLPITSELSKAIAKATLSSINAGYVTFAEFVKDVKSKLGDIPENVQQRLVKAWNVFREKYPSYGLDEATEAKLLEGLSSKPPQGVGNVVDSDELTTSIKMRKDAEKRAEHGDEPIPRLPKETQQQWLDEARRLVAEDHTLPDKLVQQVLHEPQTLGPVEFAVLQDYYAQQNKIYDQQLVVRDNARRNGDENAEFIAQKTFQDARTALDEIGRVAAISGGLWGKAGNALKMELKKDFSLQALRRRALGVKAEGTLSDAEEEQIAKLAKEIAGLKTELEKAEVKSAADEREIESLKAHIAAHKVAGVQPGAKEKPTRQPARSMKARENTLAAISKLRQSILQISTTRPHAFGLGEVAVNAADVVRVYLVEKVANFQDFMDRLKADSPDIIEMYTAMGGDWKQAWNEAHVGDITSRLVSEEEDFELGPNSIRDVARELHKFVIERDGLGPTPADRDNAVDAVHEILKDVLEDWTKHETAEAMSGIGRFSPLSKSEIDKKQREHKAQLLMIHQRGHFEKNQHPPKTGQERTPDSPYQREERRKLNDAKRKANIPESIDPERQLRSALDAAKTRMRNRLSDLREAVVAKKRIEHGKTVLVPDAELQAMQAEVDKAQSEYDAAFPKQPLTDEQRLSILDKSLDRQIKQLEEDLGTNLLYRQENIKAPLVLQPAQAAKLAKRNALVAARHELRLLSPQYRARQETAKEKQQDREIAKLEEDKAAGWLVPESKEKLTNEKIADNEAKLAELRAARTQARKESPAWQARSDAAYARQLTQRIEYWQAKINAKDFAPKPRVERQLTKDQKGLQFQIEGKKGEYDALEKEWIMQNRTPVQMVLSGLGKGYDFHRDIFSTGEMSPFGKQGLMFIGGHPLKAIVNLARGLHVLFARDDAKALSFVNQSIQARPNFKAGLHEHVPYADKLTRVTPQQEVMVGELAKQIPIVGRLVRRFEHGAKALINLMRADLVDSLLWTHSLFAGAVSKREAKVLGGAAGVMTGHGHVNPVVAKVLNKALYSTVFTMSKIENSVLAPIWAPLIEGHGWRARPVWKGTGKARVAIAVEYLRSAIGIYVMQEAARLLFSMIPAGGDDDDEVTIENDFRSSEARKLRMGRTRIDLSGGYLILPILFTRLARETKSKDGVVSTLGADYGDETQWDLMFNWARGRAHPTLSPALDRLLGGKTITGERVPPLSDYDPRTMKGWKNIAVENMPLTYPDVWKAEQELGLPRGTAALIAGMLGAGVQTYGPNKAETNQRIALKATNVFSSDDKTKSTEGIMKGMTTSEFIKQAPAKAQALLDAAKTPYEKDRAKRESDKILNAADAARADDVTTLSSRIELSKRAPTFQAQAELLLKAWAAKNGHITDGHYDAQKRLPALDKHRDEKGRPNEYGKKLIKEFNHTWKNEHKDEWMVPKKR